MLVLVLVLVLSEAVLVLAIVGRRDAIRDAPDVIIESYATTRQLMTAADSITVE